MTRCKTDEPSFVEMNRSVHNGWMDTRTNCNDVSENKSMFLRRMKRKPLKRKRELVQA